MPRLPRKGLEIEELENDQRMYGKPSKARSLEPSVFELMIWNVNHDDHRYSKKAKELSKHYGDYNHFKFLINRSGTPFVSETHDNYRTFEYCRNQQEEEEENPENGLDLNIVQNNELAEQSHIDNRNYKEAPLKNSQLMKQDEKQQKNVENNRQVQIADQSNGQAIKPGVQIQAAKAITQSSSCNLLKANQAYGEANKRLHAKETDLNKNKPVPQTKLERPVTGKITQMNPNDFQNSEDYQYRMAVKRMQQQASKKTVEEEQQEHRRAERIKKFNEQTRWLPNTGFQTYYGKPAFENYGFRNTNPSWGGLMYGSYLKSFNINPQRGENHPKFDQVYISSQLAADRVNYERDYMPRKCQDEYAHSQKEVKELINRLPLSIKQHVPVKKCGSLKKPDLYASKRFMSKTEDELNQEDNQKTNLNQANEESNLQDMAQPSTNPYLVDNNLNAKFSKKRPKTAKAPKNKSEYVFQKGKDPQMITPVYQKDLGSYDENQVCNLQTMKKGKGPRPAFSNKFIQSEMAVKNNQIGLSEGRKITFAASHHDRAQYWQ